MEYLSRRRFLKITAATFGAAAAAVHWDPLLQAAAADAPAGSVRTVPTYCEMCFWRCSGIAYVRDGKLWKFEGNPRDPQSRGRLCPRGTGAVGSHYDSDRLRKPLIRRGERGKEEWTAVTWDEAIAHIADKMGKIKAEHGPEAVAAITHGMGQRFFQHVLKSWGAINFAGPSYAQCRGPRDVGFQLTFGAGVGSPEPTDIANTDCLVLIGTHLGENMHNTQVQEFAQAVERRIPIIVVDPRFSVAASKAKYWLPIKAGTDLALLLAWMQVLVSEGRYDRTFVEKYGHGFDKFAAEIQGYTPEWAAAETGIDAHLIRTTAREFASHRPATIIHPGRRANWNGDDTQRGRAVALLSALLGNWGRKGGLYLSAGMKIAPYPLPKYPKSDKPKADGSDGAQYPFADEGITTSIRDATLTAKPYPIKGWFVYSSNILYALPNTVETLKAIDNLDLLVVIDTIPSEIAGYADVVLPESMFLERYDELLVGWGRTGWTSLRQPVVAGAERAEARVVDRKAARQQAWNRRMHAVRRHRGIPVVPDREVRLPMGGRQARRRDPGRRQADHRRGGSRARVRHAVAQGRVLVRTARRGGLRSGAEIQGARPGAGRTFAADHGARARAYVQPHADQPAAARAHAGKRGVGQPGDGHDGRAEIR